MTYVQLKEYIGIILDMEKNIYIQKNTIENLYRTRNSLGQRSHIEIPSCTKAKTDYGEYMLRVGLICAAIAFVITVIVKWGEFWHNSGIFAIILAPLAGIGIAIIAGLATGLIIGPIVAVSVSKKEQAEYDSDYQYRLTEYDRLKREDGNRVKNENSLRMNIQKAIDSLENKYVESKKRLDDFYSYNIIHTNYRHKIIAISAFYQYLSEKRTYSLERDPRTGAPGAYDIYNEEAQRGIIILQLGKVLDKLDQVLDNQRELQRTLREANRRIDSLSSGIKQMSRSINSSIQEQIAIQNYNAERTQAELEFMNTMNIFYHWR